MPCGGIYPIKGSHIEKFCPPKDHPNAKCWHCRKSAPTPDLFCDEWDCLLHSECIPAFLKTDEGEIVLNHKHEVIILHNGERVILHEEK